MCRVSFSIPARGGDALIGTMGIIGIMWIMGYFVESPTTPIIPIAPIKTTSQIALRGRVCCFVALNGNE